MPAPHDLNYSALTEEERLALRRQDAMIGFELHFNRILRDYYEERDGRALEDPGDRRP